jgi:hypothetical protein
MQYDFDKVERNDHALYKRTSNGLAQGGYVNCSLIRILWKNGRITWVPVSSKYTGYDHSTHTLTVKFKSENTLEKHMSDKLTIQPPSW